MARIGRSAGRPKDARIAPVTPMRETGIRNHAIRAAGGGRLDGEDSRAGPA